uniref:Reverse transcriptase domain-containing protein n=1 Tax=Leptobrachium leishanense TaxID=445787 RepID=A0A8C5LIY0_9ANUR
METQQPSLFLSLDAEKAFDRAEWPFLFSLLQHIRLPESFLAAINALYTSPSAQILLPGAEPIPFMISNGTRQGCPLSPALFALYLEPLLQHIRMNPGIQGLTVRSESFKVSAYADDILLSLSHPLESLPQLFKTLDEYARLSGYKININKSEAFTVHVPSLQYDYLCTNFPVRFSPSSFKYLGIMLTNAPTTLYDANYKRLWSQIKKDLECWDRYQISWVGRIYSVKMNILPRLLYFFQALPIALDSDDIRDIQRAIDSFIWQGKRHRTARATLYRPKEAGGLGLPCLLSYYYAAQLAQVVAWHSPQTSRRWVDLERGLMYPDCPQMWIWLPRAHRPFLKTTCPAIINSLRLWDKLATKCDLTSFPSPLTPIMRNRDFLPGLVSSSSEGWMGSNISRIC